jgi:hypothetical protein
VALPVCSLVFGTVTPPQKDVIELGVHLGQTNEVSSFNCLLQNFDGKYSPGGSSEIFEGVDGRIYIGRGANNPLIAQVRVENVQLMGSPSENYVRVIGRGWGERLFRRVVTKTYENMKGEAIVKDLIDNYVGLSHVRDTTELIENTDTTYTKLEYENTPVFDILKYIAATADKAGVIGFDFRVAPDGKFEFFPRNSKVSNVSLDERIEHYVYEKNVFRQRDKIYVYGAAEKKYPLDGDAWTETLDLNGDGINDWQSGTGTGTVSLANDRVAKGTYSIKHTTGEPDYYGRLRLIIPSGWQPNLNKYPSIQFQINREGSFSNAASLTLMDYTGKYATREFNIPEADKWALIQLNAGKKYENEWNWVDAGFDWSIINEVFWDVHFSGTGTGSFWVDNLFFNHARWSAVYGTGQRELAETDEELHSDNECLLRAKALYDYLSSPAEYIKLTSSVIDYGNTPILAADKLHVKLPHENVDDYYRVISVEYYLRARDQTLELTLELGREPMLLADYLYALRSKTGRLARYKIGRI